VRALLILTAVDLEARTLARHLGLPAVSGADWAHFKSGSIELACVGLRASALAARAPRWVLPALVVSAGACGALAPALAVGELIVPEVVVDTEGRRYLTTPVGGLLRAGTLLTVNEVVETTATKARLWMETGAIAVDMESAPIMAWAQPRGVAAAVLRGVSDTATEAVPADLVALVDVGGRVDPRRALRAALARPSALADALNLGRGTAAALKSVAAAVARLARG